jgi:hypothetical protein
MAIDLKIFSVCDHRIHRELIQIESDLKSLKIPRVISSTSGIVLYINDYKVSEDSSLNGFSLEYDSTVSNFKKYKLVFNQKRKALDDIYEITYSVIPNLCPKCTGQKIHNDISFNSLGIINTVQNEEKLMQDVKKGLLTNIESNPFHLWYGTNLNRIIGSKVYNIDSLRAYLIQEVNNFLDKYLDIQIKQSQYQNVTDRESYYQTLLVDLIPDEFEPTLWTLNIIFQNRTGADLAFEKKVEIPSASVGAQYFNFK